MLVVDGAGAWIVQTPLLPMKANGSGDVTAALFTAHYLATKDAATALERTASSVFDLLENTHNSGERELQLVESQEAYAHPRMQFTARRAALRFRQPKGIEHLDLALRPGSERESLIGGEQRALQKLSQSNVHGVVRSDVAAQTEGLAPRAGASASGRCR